MRMVDWHAGHVVILMWVALNRNLKKTEGRRKHTGRADELAEEDTGSWLTPQGQMFKSVLSKHKKCLGLVPLQGKNHATHTHTHSHTHKANRGTLMCCSYCQVKLRGAVSCSREPIVCQEGGGVSAPSLIKYTVRQWAEANLVTSTIRRGHRSWSNGFQDSSQVSGLKSSGDVLGQHIFFFLDTSLINSHWINTSSQMCYSSIPLIIEGCINVL